MKLDVASKLYTLLLKGHDAALTTVVKAVGSTPRKVGAEMIVTANGETFGTVGGGSGEAETTRVAMEALFSDRSSSRQELDLTNEVAAHEGLVCGGKMDIFIDIFRSSDGATADLIHKGLEAAETGREPVLVTVVGTAGGPESGPDEYHKPGVGQKTIVETGGRIIAGPGIPVPGQPMESSASAAIQSVVDTAIGPAIERVRSSGRAQLVTMAAIPEQQEATGKERGRIEFFIQPIAPAPEMLVLGGGHIAVPVVRISALLGFEVTVVDDRHEFASTKRFPEAGRVIYGKFADVVHSLDIGQSTHVVIVTRGHTHDLDCLKMLIASGAAARAAYVGMIGSPRKVAETMKILTEEGVAPEDLASVHSPIGLDIGAETPEEIAVSILAEVIDVHRGGRAHLVRLSTTTRLA